MGRRNEVWNNTMTVDQTIVFGVLIVTLVLCITETWRYDVVAFMALMAVTLTDIVPADQAFIGFGHAAVISVAAVLVLSRALLALKRGVGSRVITTRLCRWAYFDKSGLRE